MKKNVVVIPVYKNKLTHTEGISLIRCCEELSNNKIVFVSPSFLDFSEYHLLINRFNIDIDVEYFEDSYFSGIESYNKLMLSKQFYERFSAYEYMLIYQLDAYVFKGDELEDWCEKGYDYIGAPIVGHHLDTSFSMNMRVGNGGLSLRKVSVFVDAFDFKNKLLNSTEVLKRFEVYKKFWTRIPLFFFMILGFHNSLSYFAQHWKYNEDDFWSGFLDNTNYSLKKPDPIEALEFAFERFPKECYKITNKLPFGCHAWEKYEFLDFWSKYIKY